MATVDQELLFAIRGIEVLLESGVGVAEAMKHVADEDYGDLSEIFKQIFHICHLEKLIKLHLQLRFLLEQQDNIIW